METVKFLKRCLPDICKVNNLLALHACINNAKYFLVGEAEVSMKVSNDLLFEFLSEWFLRKDVKTNSNILFKRSAPLQCDNETDNW